MKKIVLMFLMLLGTLLLVACEDNKAVSSTPVLHGIEDTTVQQGSVFNIMTGVTATDEIDGDITRLIVPNGAFDINTPAVYTITYTVTNSSGKTASADRKITVTQRTEPVEEFSYYTPTKLPEDKKIYVLNSSSLESLSYDGLFTAQAIQGLFARKEAKFYLDGRSVTNLVNTDMYHLEQTVERYGLETQNISLSDAIQMYKDAWSEMVSENIWGSSIDLNDYNTYPGMKAYTEEAIDGKLAGYTTPGYIVYRKGTVSVNVAATLAGLTGFLPIELEQVNFAKANGLVEKFNIDNIVYGYKWVFDVALSEINREGLIHQNYQSPGGLTNPYIKDYGIMSKYMHVYYDSNTNAPQSFKVNLHKFLSPNRPILGYTYSEDHDVAFFSEYGQFITPTDFTYNLTYLTAETFKKDENGNPITFTQPNKQTTPKVAENKHYVAFIVSDGDNATMWQNTSLFAANFMNAVGRENDTFPVTWSLTPSLADLMPSVLSSVYGEKSNAYDHFAAPVSGQGYINAGGFIKAGNGLYFTDFLEKLNIYMNKADLGVVTIIGTNGLQNRIDVVNGYASVPSVKGGIVYEGNKYFGAVPGSVYWANGKPFVGPRDSLWETTPEYIAARINMYDTDPTKIDGYSIINVHPWSHSYEDIRTIVNMLDSDVEVVSMDTLFQLMTDNITNKTNNGEFLTPAQNGISITQEYLQSNPSLIPVNPLFNDFLLWEEDWTAVSGTVSSASQDPANSNVGSFHTSLVINGNTKARKNELTLPNIDNLYVHFVARANSQNSNETAKFKVTMTLDGVTKTVIQEASLKGVSGTGTPSSLLGEGWQFIVVDIGQYFNEYKNKKATIEIETLTSIGIKIDKFSIQQKVATPNGTFDPYNNQFLNANTEDWFLGHQFATSQYAYWGALNKDTGKPFEGGTIQMDVSDGGGDEKRNANSNLWMGKSFVLPESDEIEFEWELEGNHNEPFTGTMYKITLYVDGQMIVVQNWRRANGNQDPIKVNVSELTDINLSGKQVLVTIEVRDSGINNGVGEVAWLRYFKVNS